MSSAFLTITIEGAIIVGSHGSRRLVSCFDSIKMKTGRTLHKVIALS